MAADDLSRRAPTMICSKEELGFIMDILVWLRRLGLGQYEAVFRKNEFDETVLPGLTAGDLKNSRLGT